MARYCFYCGRELAAGEKCNCRSTGGTKSQAAGQADDSGQAGRPAAGATADAGKAGSAGKAGNRRSKQSIWQRIWQSFNPFVTSKRQTGPTAAASRTAGGSDRGPTQAGTRQNRSFRLDRATLLPELKQLVACLVQPAEGIRQVSQGDSRLAVLVTLLLRSVGSGILLVVISRTPLMRSLLDLSVVNVTAAGSAGSGLFLFLQGFSGSLAASLLLALIYQLALRYIFRQPIAYGRLLSALAPAWLYGSLFVIASLLTLPASFISALMLLTAGFAVAALAQFLALRLMTGMDENRVVILVAFVLVIDTGLIALLLNLALPVLLALMNQSAII